jgi:hypothetical protein
MEIVFEIDNSCSQSQDLWKMYYLRVTYKQRIYERRISKYDFPSNFVRVKNLGKILKCEMIARNIKSSVCFSENEAKTLLNCVVDMTIAKENKKIFESFEFQIPRSQLDLQLGCSTTDKECVDHSKHQLQLIQDENPRESSIIDANVDTKADKIKCVENKLGGETGNAVPDLIAARHEFHELVTNNYNLNSQYHYEMGYQVGYTDSQSISKKYKRLEDEEEIKRLKIDSKRLSDMNLYMEVNIKNSIAWREIIHNALK